jgi:hypothetical protein
VEEVEGVEGVEGGLLPPAEVHFFTTASGRPYKCTEKHFFTGANRKPFKITSQSHFLYDGFGAAVKMYGKTCFSKVPHETAV